MNVCAVKLSDSIKTPGQHQNSKLQDNIKTPGQHQNSRIALKLPDIKTPRQHQNSWTTSKPLNIWRLHPPFVQQRVKILWAILSGNINKDSFRDCFLERESDAITTPVFQLKISIDTWLSFYHSDEKKTWMFLKENISPWLVVRALYK